MLTPWKRQPLQCQPSNQIKTFIACTTLKPDVGIHPTFTLDAGFVDTTEQNGIGSSDRLTGRETIKLHITTAAEIIPVAWVTLTFNNQIDAARLFIHIDLQRKA